MTKNKGITVGYVLIAVALQIVMVFFFRYPQHVGTVLIIWGFLTGINFTLLFLPRAVKSLQAENFREKAASDMLYCSIFSKPIAYLLYCWLVWHVMRGNIVLTFDYLPGELSRPHVGIILMVILYAAYIVTTSFYVINAAFHLMKAKAMSRSEGAITICLSIFPLADMYLSTVVHRRCKNPDGEVNVMKSLAIGSMLMVAGILGILIFMAVAWGTY